MKDALPFFFTFRGNAIVLVPFWKALFQLLWRESRPWIDSDWLAVFFVQIFVYLVKSKLKIKRKKKSELSRGWVGKSFQREIHLKVGEQLPLFQFRNWLDTSPSQRFLRKLRCSHKFETDTNHVCILSPCSPFFKNEKEFQDYWAHWRKKRFLVTFLINLCFPFVQPGIFNISSNSAHFGLKQQLQYLLPSWKMGSPLWYLHSPFLLSSPLYFSWQQ